MRSVPVVDAGAEVIVARDEVVVIVLTVTGTEVEVATVKVEEVVGMRMVGVAVTTEAAKLVATLIIDSSGFTGAVVVLD